MGSELVLKYLRRGAQQSILCQCCSKGCLARRYPPRAVLAASQDEKLALGDAVPNRAGSKHLA